MIKSFGLDDFLSLTMELNQLLVYMIHEMRVNHDVERALLVLNLHKNTRVNFGVLINKSD